MERTIGTMQTIPTNITQTPCEMTEEIPVGAWLYLDSGKLKNSKDGSAIFFLPNAQGYAILSGDLSTVQNQIIAAFKQQEPNSTIEVTWLRVSWDYAGLVPNAPYGYQFIGFRIEAIVKNVSAGLSGVIIAGILVALAILIPLVIIASTISWTAIKMVLAAENIFKDPIGSIGTIVVGGGLVIVLVVALLLIMGVDIFGQSGKTSVKLGKGTGKLT